MKKSRFIALIMVVAMMLMGAGYAQWTDLLTVEAEVCTGDMNVEFTGEGGTWVWCNGEISEWATTTYTSIDGKTETITYGNIYPGAKLEYLTKIKNTGTIPVEIEQVMINPIECEECVLDEFLEGWIRVSVFDADGVKYAEHIENDITLGAMPEALAGITEGIRLLKDEKIAISMVFDFPCTVVNKDDLELRCCEFNVKFGFGQATCDCPEGEPDSYLVNNYPNGN